MLGCVTRLLGAARLQQWASSAFWGTTSAAGGAGHQVGELSFVGRCIRSVGEGIKTINKRGRQLRDDRENKEILHWQWVISKSNQGKKGDCLYSRA
eukprot:scaffold32779_cov17-Tisochrysis_lutea.AAC.2